MRLYVDWIPHQEAYRLYNAESPCDTIGYADTLSEAVHAAFASGFHGVASFDADTIKHIQDSEPKSVLLGGCVLEKATNYHTAKEIKAHLDSLSHDDYLARLFQEPEEYINYFDQILNHQEWKGDLSKPEQYYLEAFEKVLRSHTELYNVIRIPLHEEIPYLDREAVSLMTKKHPSLSEVKIASALTDYSPYTIVFHDDSYGLSMAKEMNKANIR